MGKTVMKFLPDILITFGVAIFTYSVASDRLFSDGSMYPIEDRVFSVLAILLITIGLIAITRIYSQNIMRVIGEIILTSGIGLFTYNILDFSYRGGHGGKFMGLPEVEAILDPFSLGRYEFEYVAYYYGQGTLFMITVGALLMIVGILMVRNR